MSYDDNLYHIYQELFFTAALKFNLFTYCNTYCAVGKFSRGHFEETICMKCQILFSKKNKKKIKKKIHLSYLLKILPSMQSAKYLDIS